MKKKIALIFGVTGQDGSYLSEFLIKKGYLVHGVKRRSSSFNTGRIDHIYQDPQKTLILLTSLAKYFNDNQKQSLKKKYLLEQIALLLTFCLSINQAYLIKGLGIISLSLCEKEDWNHWAAQIRLAPTTSPRFQYLWSQILKNLSQEKTKTLFERAHPSKKGRSKTLKYHKNLSMLEQARQLSKALLTQQKKQEAA